jgi:hypothetical protein
MVQLAGLSLPAISAFDPPTAGEGGIDPMGLAAISDRLADLLVPGLRARMSRVRFLTAMAVGSLTCEPLAEEPPADEVSTPAICFEWLVVEAFVRRLGSGGFPEGVPGSQKARAVIHGSGRLSAATYLKGPTVFGFNGVYKPFAMDAGIVGSNLEPGERCVGLVRAWERDQGFEGFADEVPGSSGGRLRIHIRDEVRSALGSGRCTTNPGGLLFGHLATALHPSNPGVTERGMLRSLITDGKHRTRGELAGLVPRLDETLSEAQILGTVRPASSANLRRIIDAVVAYERLAALVDAAFRTLCSVSYSRGTQPVTADLVRDNETIVRCAAELPDRYRRASEHVAAVAPDIGLEERLGEFALGRTPRELVELVMAHHEQVQAAKPPSGKRPWFEPLRDGWVVRSAFGSPEPPELGPWFVHPVRVAPLRAFMKETAP